MFEADFDVFDDLQQLSIDTGLDEQLSGFLLNILVTVENRKVMG